MPLAGSAVKIEKEVVMLESRKPLDTYRDEASGGWG
jgi:hypothetical protein